MQTITQQTETRTVEVSLTKEEWHVIDEWARMRETSVNEEVSSSVSAVVYDWGEHWVEIDTF